MASSNQPSRPLDIKLTIRYNGVKATQYFSKFTPESKKVVCDDLLVLKLPLPKRDNIHLLSHGVVECQWFGVASQGILHRHIVAKSEPTQEMLQPLHIATIKAVYNHLPMPHMQTNGVKRPNPYASTGANNAPGLPGSSAQAGPSNLGAAMISKKASVPSQNVFYNSNIAHPPIDRSWVGGAPERPYKKPKLDHEDTSSSVSQQSPTFPAFTNLPPLLPRQQGTTNARVFAPKKPPKATDASQKPEQLSSVTPSVAKNDLELSKAFQKARLSTNEPLFPAGNVNQPGLSTGRDTVRTSSASSVPNERSFRVKQEPNDNDDSFLLRHKPTPQSNQTTLQNDQPPVPNQSTLQTASSAFNAPETSNESEREKGDGDLLVKNFLESLKLKTDVQTHETPQTSNQESQKSISPNSQDLVPQAGPLYAASPSSSVFYGRSDWYRSSEVPPFRGPAVLETETMSSIVSPTTTTPSTSQLVSTPSASSSEGPPVKIQTSTSTSSSGTTHTHPRPEENIDEMPYKYRYKPQIRESRKDTCQRLQRELFDIKREINANAAREAAVIAQLKDLKVSNIPDPVKIGHDPSEEMKDNLARLEHELAAERKLREEAECVIADIRREMKAPFVVPSLFDAFVKLSKLTTQGLRAGGPSASGPSEPSKDQPTDLSLSDMSVSQTECVEAQVL